MTAGLAQAGPVAAWVRVLETIDEALARRLAEVEEPPAPMADPTPAAKGSLQALEERLRQMQARLERAERDAAEADGPLRGEAEAYRRWTEGMTAARRRLADWAAAVK